MIATKTIARLLHKEYRKQRKKRKNLSWFTLASVARIAMVKSLLLHDGEYTLVNLSVDVVRHYFDTGDPIQVLDDALDNAQGKVFSEENALELLVLLIKK